MKHINHKHNKINIGLFTAIHFFISTVSKTIIKLIKVSSQIYKAVLIIVFILFTIHIQGQINIDSCHYKAHLNFPMIKQYGLIEQSKNYNLSNANKAYLPQLDLNIIGGILEGLPSMGAPGTEESGVDMKLISVAQVNQVIWDGGITKAKKKAIVANSEIAKSNLDVSLYMLEERVNNLFFGVLLIDEQLKQIDLLQASLKRNHKRVETAVKNGTAFLTDLDEVKVLLIEIEQKKENLSYNRKSYINVLSALIGQPINSDALFEMPKSVSTVLSDSINRPELKLFKQQRLLIEAQQDLNKAMLYPKIGIMGFGTFIQPGLDFGASSIDNILVAGLSLNWNLGSLYKNANNKKLVKLDLDKINLNQETFLFNTNLELEQQKVDLQRWQKQIEKDKELLVIKKRIKEAFDVKYENGTCTMSALLDRVNDESMAQQNLTTHQIQFLLKAYQYQNLTGNRTSKIH